MQFILLLIHFMQRITSIQHETLTFTKWVIIQVLSCIQCKPRMNTEIVH